MEKVLELKEHAKGFRVLYAEDNEPLRLNATKLLSKFFDDVVSAADGLEALEIFKKSPADILITDIKMPGMDGLALAKEIHEIAPKTKMIVMSAFDEKELLMEAIKSGIFSYLKKPVNVKELTATLYDAIEEIEKEQANELFYANLKSVFNYQSSMVAMLDGDALLMVNQFFLDFFAVKNIEEFTSIYGSLGSQFLEHDSFLYNYAGIEWFSIVETNEKKLFHVKMRDSTKKIHHFILKYKKIPEKKAYGILSFDDITELNLLGLFDAKKAKNDEEIEKTHSLINLLEVLQRNSAEIEVHNFYKGLSITNSGIIMQVLKDSILLKSTFLQLKGMQIEQKVILVSDVLPYHLECSVIKKIGFEKQQVELAGLRFVETSAVQRKTIRVSVAEHHSVSLFVEEKKFHTDIEIEDISLDGVRLSLGALPAGLNKGDDVRLDIVLEVDKRPMILNTKATLYAKREHKYSFSLVFLFEDIKKSELTRYITKRQMAIIREFKGMQNG